MLEGAKHRRSQALKSPEALAAQLARQWHSADLREQRLLDPGAWPVQLSIGLPAASVMTHQTARVREHTARWRNVAVGRVEWRSTNYRSAAEPVSLPHAWHIASPAEWAEASGDATVSPA